MNKFKLNVFVTLLTLLIIISNLWPLLNSKRTFVWDPSVWYGIYYYFANGIYNNFLSLWNPHMNGGEPFWPVFGLFRLIDPLNIFFILIGKLFNFEIFYLYNIQFVCKYLITCFGVFLFLYQLYRNYLLSFSVSCIFLISCFTINLWDGVYMAFCWVPFILLFFIKFIQDDYKVINLAITVLLTGLFLGSSYYHFIYFAFIAYFYFLVYFIPRAIRNKKLVINYLSTNKKILTILISLFILMLLPMLYTFIDYIRELYPVARTAVDRDLFDSQNTEYFNYKFTMSNFQFFFTPTQTLDSILYFPFAGSNNILQNLFSRLILLVAFFGVIKNRSSLNIPTVLIFILILFLVVGKITPIHEIACYLFPPLFITRHTHIFLIFEYLIICIYFGFGVYYLSNYFSKCKFICNIFALLILNICLYLIINGILMTQTQDINAYKPTFKHGASKPEFINNREFAMGRTAYYLYEPILYNRNVALQMIADPPKEVPREDYPLFKEWALNTLNPSDRVLNLIDPSYGYRTIYWLNEYLFNYKLTELDSEKFKLLMKVNEPLVSFNTQYFVITKDMVKNLFLFNSVEDLKLIFKNYGLIINKDISEIDNEKWNSFNHNLNIKLDAKNNFNYEVIKYSPGNILIKLKNIHLPGILQYSDMNSIGWRVYVDESELSVLTMAGGFKGVHVNPNNTTVEFRYVPRVYIYSTYLYLIISVILFPILILFLKIKEYRCKFKIHYLR